MREVTNAPEMGLPPEREAPVWHRRGLIISPAVEDGTPKDQDQAAHRGRVACVADGVSSSPYGREAADRVVETLLGHHGPQPLNALATELEERRKESLTRNFTFPSAHNEAMRKYLEDAFREKLKCAYQTTFCAVFLGEPLLFQACGDAAAFVFCDDGAFEIFPDSVTVPSRGSATRVLPDDLDAVCVRSIEARSASDVVLATDGFYNAFTDPPSLLEWLKLHENDYPTAVETLHEQLAQTRGDDDISAIWLSRNPKGE